MLSWAKENGAPYDLWVVTSITHWDCMETVLEDDRWSQLKAVKLHPGETSDRVSTASVGSAELFFLHGMLCSYASTSGTVGFVVSDPRNSNIGTLSLMGFYYGAQYTNRSTRVLVGITGNFIDANAETKATSELINTGGADCIGSIQNDLTVHRIAAAQNKFSVGVAADARFFVGETVLSSILLFWQNAIEPFYLQIANQTWVPNYALHLAQGTNGSLLSSLSTLADPSWQDSLEDAQSKFLNGSLDLHCSTLVKDPQWMSINNTYELRPGVRCMSQDAFYRITGIVQGASVLVEFNNTNPPYDILYVSRTSFAGIFAIIVSSLLFWTSVATIIVVVWNLYNPIIRAASPLFLLITLSGLIITSVAPLTNIGPPTRVRCMIIWWFYGIGHALTWSCLIAKNWRIWRILASARLRPIAILNTELLVKWVICIVLAEIIVLTTWNLYSPLIPSVQPSSTLSNDELQIICVPKPNRYNGGLLTWLGFNLAILLPGALVSYWTRNARGEYDESRSLAASIYGTFVITFALGGVGFGLPRNYYVEFYLVTFGPLLIAFTVWALIFIPKLVRLASAVKESPSQLQEFQSSALQSRNLRTPHNLSNVMFSSASSSASN